MGVASVRGRHYTEWAPVIKVLKRQGRLDEALDLSMECMAATLLEARVKHWTPAPAYTRHAAIILRKLKRYDEEVAVLERYIQACPGLPPDEEFRVRLAKARTLRDNHSG